MTGGLEQAMGQLNPTSPQWAKINDLIERIRKSRSIKHSKAKQSKAKQSKAKQSKALTLELIAAGEGFGFENDQLHF